MPCTPEVYRMLRDHGVAVDESVTNDRESMKGVFTFLKHKEFLHKIKGRYSKTFRLEFETFMTDLCKKMPNVAKQMKIFLERKIKTETFNPLRVATECCDGIISRKVFKTLRDIYEEKEIEKKDHRSQNLFYSQPALHKANQHSRDWQHINLHYILHPTNPHRNLHAHPLLHYPTIISILRRMNSHYG